MFSSVILIHHINNNNNNNNNNNYNYNYNNDNDNDNDNDNNFIRLSKAFLNGNLLVPTSKVMHLNSLSILMTDQYQYERQIK